MTFSQFATSQHIQLLNSHTLTLAIESQHNASEDRLWESTARWMDQGRA